MDLSRNVRLAGLVSGAKIELAQASRSQSVVSVALQLPETEAQGSNNRLVDKFPSNTTVWMVLRKFESVASPSQRNYTARSVPMYSRDGGGEGRLYFATPVVQVMGRELSAFTDLQMTLAQLGFNRGSALLRLTFRTTDTPLEEALQGIGQYFADSKEPDVGTAERRLSAEVDRSVRNDEDLGPSEVLTLAAEKANTEASPSAREASVGINLDVATPPVASTRNDALGESFRNVTIFAPPSSDTPKAAQQPFNEKDYEPTIDHAKLHQSRLAAAGTNKRLLSDAELLAQAEAKAAKKANAQEVQIKIRLPDQLQVVSKFSNVDTAQTLYDFVKGMMIHEREPFELRFSAAGGFESIPTGPQSDAKLIGHLGMLGRVLVNMIWSEGASIEARTAPVLKEEYRQKAQMIEVVETQEVAVKEEGEDVQEYKGKEEKGKKGGMPKWLKLPGQK